MNYLVQDFVKIDSNLKYYWSHKFIMLTKTSETLIPMFDANDSGSISGSTPV